MIAGPAPRTDPAPTNIVEAMRMHARLRPDTLAMTFLADGERQVSSLTFASLDALSRGIAGKILEIAPEAKRALILQEPGLDFVLSLCACFHAGIAAVPTPPPAARVNSNSAQRFARLLLDAEPDVILTHSGLLSRLQWLVHEQAGLSPRKWVRTDACEPAAASVSLKEIQPVDVALIQYTSGSVAEPKGVLIDHANLAANLAAIAEKFALTPDSVVVNWLPPYHDMGLIGGIIEGVWCGYRVVLMDPKHFIARPLRWLEAIEHFQADVSGGANFAFDLCADAVAKGGVPKVDLSRWRLAYSGAEPVRASSIQRFAEAFADCGFRRNAFYPCYGLAEATLMASGPEPGAVRPVVAAFLGDALDHGQAIPAVVNNSARALVSCGTPCPETLIEIIDPDSGRPLSSGGCGEIWLSGPGVFRGYWRGDGTENFRILSKHPGRKFLPTGDLGFLWDGELFVSGRLKDLIIHRGRNISPSDVEDVVVLGHPAVAPNAAVAFAVDTEGGEEMVVACEIRREFRHSASWPEVFTAIRTRLAESGAPTPVDIVLLRPGALARTTSGKIRRQACRRAYLDGTWAPLARLSDLPITETSIERQDFASADPAQRLSALDDYLKWRLSQLTAIPEVFLSSDTSLDGAGLDSLKRVEFALLIEAELGRPLPADWMARDHTVSSLATAIRTSKPLMPDEGTPAKVPLEAKVPMTPLQAAFLEGEPERPESFLEVLYFRTPAGLDVEALRTAMAALDRHHDAFALRFRREQSGWAAYFDAPGNGLAFERIDIASRARHELAGLREDALKRVRAAIRLDTGPLVSAVYLDRGPDERGILAVGFHHLVIDAVSLSIWATQLQAAYTNVIANRSPLTDRPRTQFGAWLRALHRHGQSGACRAEASYWRSVCGPASDGQPVIEPEHPMMWRSTGKTTLSMDQNRRLLEVFRTPLARNAVILAALCRAWVRVTGEATPLIQMESHGRHPFPDADPTTAMGWFVTQYPFAVPASAACGAAALYETVSEALDAVPNLGIGYGLLRQDMAAFRRPTINFQYRGNIDDTFRKDSVLPLISVHHEGAAYRDSARRRGDHQPLAVMAGLSDGVQYWSITYTPSIPDTQAMETLEEMRQFFVEIIDQA